MKCLQCGHQTYRARGGKQICPRCGYGASAQATPPAGTASDEEESAPAAKATQTVPLICSQCGGKLSVERGRVSSAARGASVRPGERIVCPYCGTEFLPGDQIGQARETINIVGSGVVVGDGSSSTVTIVTPGDEDPQRRASDGAQGQVED